MRDLLAPPRHSNARRAAKAMGGGFEPLFRALSFRARRLTCQTMRHTGECNMLAIDARRHGMGEARARPVMSLSGYGENRIAARQHARMGAPMSPVLDEITQRRGRVTAA